MKALLHLSPDLRAQAARLAERELRRQQKREVTTEQQIAIRQDLGLMPVEIGKPSRTWGKLLKMMVR